MFISRSLFRDQRGVSAVEYALLLGSILLVVVAGFRLLGHNVKTQAECASQFGAGCTHGKDENAAHDGPGPFGSVRDWIDREMAAAGAWLNGIGRSLSGAQPPTFANEVHGTMALAIDQDLSHIAGDVNGADNGNPIGGFRRLKPNEIPPGITVPLNDPTTGFHAALYMNPQGQVVVAYGSTRFGDYTNAKDVNLGPFDVKVPIDVENDVLQAEGQLAPQYQEAVELARQAKAVYGENVICTGHSLGGGLCSAASLANDMPGVTFNAAGLHDETIKRFGGNPDEARRQAESGLDRAYHVKGEPLTTVQQNTDLPKAPGKSIELSDPIPYQPCFMCFERDLNHTTQLHSAASVDAAMAKDRPWEK